MNSVPPTAEILVVDDEAPNLGLFRIILEEYGYKVRTAADGTSALQMAQSPPPI